MKREIDTVVITLDREPLRLQQPSSFYDNETSWHIWNQGPHDHSAYEMHILLKGAAQVRIGEELHLLRAGYAMIIAPRQYHEAWAMQGEFLRFSFVFSPEEKTASMTQMLRRRIPLCHIFRASEEMLGLSERILQDWVEKSTYRRDMRETLFKALMISTFRVLELSDKVDPIRGELPRILICDGYFADGRPNKCASQLAKYLRVSERQLHRCLMEFYGMSFQQKLTQTRMEKAAWFLRTTDKRVNEIAEDVGYDSESGFFKVFRKHFQMTPLQYRKKYRIQQSFSEEESKL